MPATTQTLVNNVTLAATLARRSKGYVDQIIKALPFYWYMMEKKRYKGKDGGLRLEWNVQYDLDEREKSYQGLDVLPKMEQDNVTVAIAEWKQYHGDIVISGADMLKNQGGNKIFDLLQQKEDNAKASLQLALARDLYEDGTGNSYKVITGLGAITPELPTSGVLFGIDRATNAFWRSQYLDVNAKYYDVTNSRFTLREKMDVMRTRCGRLGKGDAKSKYPDLGLCTESYMHWFETGVDKSRRYVDQKAADAGFDSIKFKGMTIMPDELCPESSTSGEQQCFFLNSNYLELAYMNGANFKPTPMTRAENQDGFYMYIFWMGELICETPAKHGRLFGVQDL